MSERNYYVTCDDNCKFPAYTAEQVLELIAQATSGTLQDIDEAFITKIKDLNHNNNLRFWVGTEAQYNALSEHETDVLYIVENSDDKGADFIVERGNVDNWQYRKYDSGVAECWGRFTVNTSSQQFAAVNGLYFATPALILPIGLFITSSDMVVTCSAILGARWVNCAAVGTSTISLQIITVGETITSCDVAVNIKGRWK